MLESSHKSIQIIYTSYSAISWHGIFPQSFPLFFANV